MMKVGRPGHEQHDSGVLQASCGIVLALNAIIMHHAAIMRDYGVIVLQHPFIRIHG